LATVHGRRAAHDEIDKALQVWAGDRDLDETVETLVAAGIPAGRAVDPRLTAFHPQLAARRFCEEIDHPVIGRQPVPTVPFRFSDVDHWLRRPAPTFGEHNHEVLSDLLDLTPAEILALEDAGVIASVPVGL
jgi:crotonobetainyl-CoA:carnitine CoA-transferase CaiB-like acyl-CoA transferase